MLSVRRESFDDNMKDVLLEASCMCRRECRLVDKKDKHKRTACAVYESVEYRFKQRFPLVMAVADVIALADECANERMWYRVSGDECMMTMRNEDVWVSLQPPSR